MPFLLHQLLSDSAARYPNKDAIIFSDQTITYAKLEEESNKLAHELVRLGVKRGSRVGIYMKRGINPIVAAFAIMKMGGTYVPIDPMSPPRRLKYIVRKCDMKAIFTHQERLKNIEEVFTQHLPFDNILLMDGLDQSFKSVGPAQLIDCQGIPDELGINPPTVNIIDSDLAYILFTSGSTGDPKGVMISHLNSLTFVNTAHDFFNIKEQDRSSNISPLHFDMSVFDIFVPVKAGASMVIIPENIAFFPMKLAELISKSKISAWNSVPSALSILASLSNLHMFDFSAIRLVLFAGDIFPIKFLRRLQKLIPQARFCNMYGQTEANSSTYHWVNHVLDDDSEILPIGKALPNFEVFALDDDGKLVFEAGQEGELFVRASSVALGYMGEADRSEKCFVENPLKPNSNEKVFRTGDVVRLDSKGNYVFVGRKDHMIKSRGYRIELGEIETVLCNHPQVGNAVVIPIQDELVGNRISAIVVPLTPRGIEKKELLRYCSERLPKYMIPESIDFRDSLPMTSSGKVDRKQLSQTNTDPLML